MSRRERILKFKEDCQNGTVQKLLDKHYRYIDLAKAYGISPSSVCVYTAEYNLKLHPLTNNNNRPTKLKRFAPEEPGPIAPDIPEHIKKLALYLPWTKQQ